MTKNVKRHGRVYTPSFLVNAILNFGGYNGDGILQKHVVDNSCGDGAFLVEIVGRYCTEFLRQHNDLSQLKENLETFVHGIELDEGECEACRKNLDSVAERFNVVNVNWDVINADTLTVDSYGGKMDFVFGNPPYVRVHNLAGSYDAVKKYHFAQSGMTDLFIVFFEIGFNMLAKNGSMCLITPSSWLNSRAGKALRDYIVHCGNMTGLIDLEHFQPFEATTYTLISRFKKSPSEKQFDYYTYDTEKNEGKFQARLSLDEINIGGNFYLAHKDKLQEIKRIKSGHHYKYVSVKNGFATLADKVFIGDFDFSDGTIDILKASTGKWSKCIYPYDGNGKPLTIKQFSKHKQAFDYLTAHKDQLSKNRDIDGDEFWYLFGRTQALNDVSRTKYAVNTIIKDIESIKLEIVETGKGVYSGLYILTDIAFDEIREIVFSDEFIGYIKMLKNYKSGGYYTFTSKDLEQFLNYKLTQEYGQSRISASCKGLF